MSEVENPVMTVLRLIENKIRVITDGGGVAAVKCTQEHFNRELLKDHDAQITVGIDPTLGTQDQKLTMDGRVRRRIFYLRATTFTWEKTAPGKDTGLAIRQKLNEQLNTILRENRNLPYQYTYSLYALGALSSTHKAYDLAFNSEVSPAHSSWVELSDANYAKVWSNDDVLHSKSTSTAGQYPMMLFRFKIGLKSGESSNEPREQSIKSIILTFVGYGTAAAGNGATVQVWNHRTAAWTNPATGTAPAKETLTITLSSAWTDYIDSEGYLYMMARTTNASAGAATVLYCDFVQCVTQTLGITRCDVVKYSDVDNTTIQPIVYTSAFIIKTWLIETLSV